ncbi:MAG: hypothetical protein HRT35_33885 [Algicola sp.]|nr:hypothetical protein [Algicola sp.]
MDKITRSAEPAWLAEKWQEWGEDLQAKYAEAGKASGFIWHQYNNQGYKTLVEALSAMTVRHCSFCDAFPMGSSIPNTIEHFKPKSIYPLFAYKWDNLFLCCGICQRKGDKFDEMLLKPDSDSYSFDDYFDIHWDTGELIPNRDASHEAQASALLTIELYQLNKNGKPSDRKRELTHYQLMKNSDSSMSLNIDEFSFRFYLTRGVS